VDERPEQAWPREPLEVGARLGEAAADALDLADPEASADERVQAPAVRTVFQPLPVTSPLGGEPHLCEGEPRIARTGDYSL
jgi:hypothetical protein